jgi:hypothetical protein
MWKILKNPRIIIIILAMALLMLQTIRVERLNPPVQSDLSAKPEIQALLRGACYNCHSNQTVWPWYSRIAPASWLTSKNVRDGRQHLNFSEWGTYSVKERSRQLEKIAHKVIEVEMPPWYYNMMNRDRRLTLTNRAQIWAWALTESEAIIK